MDLATAFCYAAPGQTFIMEGGTYTFKEGLTVLRGVNGTEEAPVTLQPAEGETVILDFAKEGSAFRSGAITGISKISRYAMLPTETAESAFQATTIF